MRIYLKVKERELILHALNELEYSLPDESNTYEIIASIREKISTFENKLQKKYEENKSTRNYNKDNK